MKTIVFDVPAESGGALSILNEFYEKAIKDKDKSNKWIFVVSKPKLESTANVKVLRYPWIKKSWLHRLYFDYFKAYKLVEKYNADKVLSLQNLIIPRISGGKQSLYVHQSLPFVEYKFKFLENKLLWIYQNIIGKLIFRSIKQANHVIVQTDWMKEKCIEMIKVDKEKIEVCPPKIDIEIENLFIPNKKNLRTFFYPAGSAYYKNHRIIVEASENLINQGIQDFSIVFTLKGNETKHINYLHSKVINLGLPIKFIGQIKREEVFDYYTKSILLFPSYVETFGLPILEARLHKGIILVSDCNFSREILKNYKYTYFFNPFSANELEKLMKNILV